MTGEDNDTGIIERRQDVLIGRDVAVGAAAGIVVGATSTLVIAFVRRDNPGDTFPRLGAANQAWITIEENRSPFGLSVTATRRLDSGTDVTLVEFNTAIPLAQCLAEARGELRGETRVTPQPGPASQATITFGSTRLTGRVKDVSMTGIGLLFNAEADATLASTRTVILEIDLPDVEHPVVVGGVIQHRLVQSDGSLLYGLRFLTGEDTPTPLALVRYVMKGRGIPRSPGASCTSNAWQFRFANVDLCLVTALSDNLMMLATALTSSQEVRDGRRPQPW